MAKAEASRVPETNADFELPVQLLATDGLRGSVSAQIRRVNNGFFQLRTSGPVDVGRRFSLDYDACRTELEVIYCQRPGIGPCYVGARILTAGVSTARRDLRLPVEIPASASVPGILEHARAVVKGISALGLRVMLSARVEPGSMIVLDIGNGVAFGEVKESQESPDGHHQAEVSLHEFLERTEDHRPHAGTRDEAPSRGLFRRLLSKRQ